MSGTPCAALVLVVRVTQTRVTQTHRHGSGGGPAAGHKWMAANRASRERGGGCVSMLQRSIIHVYQSENCILYDFIHHQAWQAKCLVHGRPADTRSACWQQRPLYTNPVPLLSHVLSFQVVWPAPPSAVFANIKTSPQPHAPAVVEAAEGGSASALGAQHMRVRAHPDLGPPPPGVPPWNPVLSGRTRTQDTCYNCYNAPQLRPAARPPGPCTAPAPGYTQPSRWEPQPQPQGRGRGAAQTSPSSSIRCRHCLRRTSILTPLYRTYGGTAVPWHGSTRRGRGGQGRAGYRWTGHAACAGRTGCVCHGT